MLFFSHRRKLENLFLKWCKDTDAANRPMNVVAFLQSNGLIDEDKALEFIKNTSVEVKSNG